MIGNKYGVWKFGNKNGVEIQQIFSISNSDIFLTNWDVETLGINCQYDRSNELYLYFDWSSALNHEISDFLA